MNFFNWLINLFSWGDDVNKVNSSKARGEIILGYGLHEVKIDLERCCKVFICIKDCDGPPVCHCDVNKIGVKIVDNGFVLYADIKTNSCTIEWTCK